MTSVAALLLGQDAEGEVELDLLGAFLLRRLAERLTRLEHAENEAPGLRLGRPERVVPDVLRVLPLERQVVANVHPPLQRFLVPLDEDALDLRVRGLQLDALGVGRVRRDGVRDVDLLRYPLPPPLSPVAPLGLLDHPGLVQRAKVIARGSTRLAESTPEL